MGFHSSGWWSVLRSTDEKPVVTRELLLRVAQYSRPYAWLIFGMLIMILIGAGLSLLTPLILRDLIDNTIPGGDIQRLLLSSVALLLIPILSGLAMVIQRWLNARVGEGVIFDLRVSLYSHLQRMSLRFFTNTRVGEMMSRLNNDVVGAQNAISNTLVNMITNLIQAAAVLVVMLRLEWRLTLVSIIILPLFIVAARRMGTMLRDIARQAMDHNAQMNAMMNETLNIGGALLVKLFGRISNEIERFSRRAIQVRDIGIRRAVVGSSFFLIIGLVSAIGTALVYGVGGFLAIEGFFTIGTIVAFAAYLTTLYGALQGLANAPVEFSTSVVSFERVFEVIDMPLDIQEIENAQELKAVQGALRFDGVTFSYAEQDAHTLSYVKRYGQVDNVTTFHAFLTSCAQATGQVLNITTLAHEAGISDHTARRWISLLEDHQIIFLLKPYHTDFGKRVIKSPKLYFYDPGVVCSLLKIEEQDLPTHASRLKLFESLIIVQLS